ncbi:hypothetical protein LMG7974_01599 [Campylobacter majalis]|uniref:Vapd n=1 Tax=Campylobacter majalis TaxID=2790656 RepID=A0ABM8Q9P3_9BACT|nr:virulence associated protein D [Campylobacter majalis]CAD7289522.1 hypothetical protein LMG7974_01599 [Campylobacter majalis]
MISDEPHRKSINFDFDTKKLEELTGSKTKAYYQIEKFMLENGFIHRQGSGYLSKETLQDYDIFALIEKMVYKFEWFYECYKKFDVARYYDDEALTYDRLISSVYEEKQNNEINQALSNTTNVDCDNNQDNAQEKQSKVRKRR